MSSLAYQRVFGGGGGSAINDVLYLSLGKSLSWMSGGALTQATDGIYTLTDAAGDNNVSLQIGTGTASSGTGNLGITFGTRGSALALNLSKNGAGAQLAVLTGAGSWASAVSASWGLNGFNGSALGISNVGTTLTLNGAGGAQVQSAGTIRSGTAATPNGAVTGSPGDIYFSTSGGAGATLWVKETGAATNTGWVSK